MLWYVNSFHLHVALLTRPAQCTRQFASVSRLENPEEPIAIADEIESVFNVALYNALRYLRHSVGTGSQLRTTVFDFFEDYQLLADYGQRYRCGVMKRDAMRYGWLRTSEDQPYAFVGDEVVPRHPINKILVTMLRWFKARYTKPDEMQEEIGTVEGEQNRRRMESNLDSYDALLSLLDEKLKLQWPADDKVGDQLAEAQSVRSDAMDLDSQDGSRDCDWPVEAETSGRPAKRRKRGD